MYFSTRTLFLSRRLLLLVVDGDGDDRRAAADHADSGQAPLELAVGHALDVVHVLGVDVVGFLFDFFFFFWKRGNRRSWDEREKEKRKVRRGG